MSSKLHFQLNQSWWVYPIILISILGIGALQIPHLNRLTKQSETRTPEVIKQAVEQESLRLNILKKTPSFGFNNIFANWTFLGFLIYFGDDQSRNITGYDLSPKYFEIIVDQDPRFVGAYISLSNSISMYAAMPEKSVALMAQGLKSMSPESPPKSYFVWRYKAIDQLLFLGDAQGARQSFEKAAEWASTYSDQESKNVAAISAKTAEFLARNPNSRLAQFSAWIMVLSNTTDPRSQKIAISRIEALGGKVFMTPGGKVEKIQPPVQD